MDGEHRVGAEVGVRVALHESHEDGMAPHARHLAQDEGKLRECGHGLVKRIG